MFTRFLERKLWAQKNEDVTDITFFDEHIRLKQGRNGAFKAVSRFKTKFIFRNKNQHFLKTLHRITNPPSIVSFSNLFRNNPSQMNFLNSFSLTKNSFPSI